MKASYETAMRVALHLKTYNRARLLINLAPC